MNAVSGFIKAAAPYAAAGTALVFCLVCLSVLQSGRVFKKVLTSNRSVAIIEVTERLQKTLGVKLWQEIQRNAF